jgi:hypothetical protein
MSASATKLVHPVAPQGERWTDWLLSFVWLRFAIYLVAIRSLIQPLFVNGRHLVEHMDEHQFHGWELSNKITLLRYHQLPAWNPYWCGGTVGVAAPEDIFFAPDNLLRLLFEVEIARHLSVLLGLCLAAEGTYRLARAMGSSSIAALGAAFIYTTNPMLALWTWVGFFNFVVGFGVMPWVGWCALMGIERPAYRYLGAFFFAWIFLSAGTYPAPYTLMLIGYLTVCMAVMTRRRASVLAARPFISSAGLGVVFVLLVLVKFVPLMLFLKQFSRTWNVVEQHPPQEILAYLTANHSVVFALAVMAVLTRDRWAIVCLLGAAIFFGLSMGDFHPLSPYHLLKQLPLFKQLRSPERHVTLLFLFVALGAARMITILEDSIPKAIAAALGARSVSALPRVLRVAVVGAGTLVVALALGPRYQQTVTAAAAQFAQLAFTFEPARPYAQEFRQHRGNRRDAHVFPAVNMGSIYCITGIPVPQSALLRADLAQEEYPLDPALATVRRVRWSPNEITLDVQASRATRVLVNQNYERHWRSSVGTVVSHQGLLAVDVPAGRHTVVLEFVDRALQLSLLVSALTLLALGAMLAKHVVRSARATLDSLRARPAPAVSAAKTD